MENEKIFNGVGCFKDYKVHLDLKLDAIPVIQKARQIPFHFQEKRQRFD